MLNYRIWTALFVLAMQAATVSAIETGIVDLTTETAPTDVSITRQGNNMIFRDSAVAGTKSLTQLLSGGVTSHSALSGLTADDHGVGANQYYNPARLHTKFGSAAATTTVGAEFTSSTATPADPAGKETVGGHVLGTLIHWFRPPRVVTVGPDDGSKKAEFTSVLSAIDSITDAGPSKRYVVYVYPGTYTERLTMANSYIALMGQDELSCIITNTSGPILQVNGANPGRVSNLSFQTNTVGDIAVRDASSGSRYDNVTFAMNRGTAFKKTAQATTTFRRCTFRDAGATGVDAQCVLTETGGVPTTYYIECGFETANQDCSFIRATDSGTHWLLKCWEAPISDCVNNGAIKITGTATVYAWDFFAPTSTLIDSGSTGGGVYVGPGTYVAAFGSAVGVTTGTFAVAGGKFTSDVNIQGTGGVHPVLKMGGNMLSDDARNVTALTVDATTGTFDNLVAGSFSATTNTAGNWILPWRGYDPSSQTLCFEVGTTGVLTIMPKWNNTTGTRSVIYKTSGTTGKLDKVVDYSQVKLNSGIDFLEYHPSFSIRSDGYAYFGAGAVSGASGFFSAGSYGIRWAQQSSPQSTELNPIGENKAQAYVLKENGTGGGLTSPVLVFQLGPNDNKTTFGIVEGGSTWMAGNAKTIHPDGTDAPFIVNIGARAAYMTHADSAANVTWVNTKGEVTIDAVTTVCFDFPIHSDVQGANVVIDRITCYCAATGDLYVNMIYLRSDDGNARISHTGDFTSDHQWVDSDYTMDDILSYYISVDVADSGSGGDLNIRRFKVEYHLE